MATDQDSNNLNATNWWTVDRSHQPRMKRGATPLVERCIRTYGWSEAFALRVLDGYRQFLIWKQTFDDWDATKLSPSLPIQMIWRQHILDTRNYPKDCQLLCGKLVHHDSDADLAAQAHKIRIENTKCALCMRFGDNYDKKVWNFGDDENETGPRTVCPTEHCTSSSRNDNDLVVIRIRDHGHITAHCQVKYSTLLGSVFKSYAIYKKEEVSSMKFFHKGEQIVPSQTAKMLDFEKTTLIDVFYEQS